MPDFERPSNERRIDYSSIFGGIGDDDEVEEERRRPAEDSRSSAASSIKSNGSKLPNGSYVNQTPSKVSSSRSSDSVENINVSYHRSTTKMEERKRGGTFIAEVRAVPGFASVHDEVGPSRKKAAVDSVQVKLKDDSIYMDFSVEKKQRKLSREAIPHVAPVEKPVILERGDVSSTFCGFDKSQQILEVSSKAESCNTMPMSISPQSNDVKSDLRRSSTSSFKDCEMAAGSSSPTFSILGEELDENSEAAVFAAAVKRAIEEAEVMIRLAKELPDRNDGQGFAKMTFRDHLKFKVIKDDKHVSHDNGLKENVVDQNSAQIDPPVVSSVIEEENESQVRSASLDSVDQKEVSDDVEIKNNMNANELISTQGSHSSEGIGEWEAARHLSQLFNGVKNRLVSFMAWQGDGEKKPMQKQPAPVSGSLDQANSCERAEKDPKLAERDETNVDQDIDSPDYRGEPEGNKMACASEVNHLEANDLKENALQQETVYMGFNVWPAANDMEPNDLLEPEQETFTENQESLGNNFSSEEYEVSALDAAKSALDDEILDQAECMTESDGHKATGNLAVDECPNGNQEEDVPDNSMTSYDGRYGTQMEEFKERERPMQKLVHEHHVEFEGKNEAYPARAIVEEEQKTDYYKLEGIDGINIQAVSGLADNLKKSSQTGLTEKMGGEEEAEDASKEEENEQIERQAAHGVASQQQYGSKMVSETYYVAEIVREGSVEDGSTPSDDTDTGIKTEPRDFLERENDRNLLINADLVGEIREGAATEDADKSEENQVRREIEQEVPVEQLEVTGMPTEATLLEETIELEGAEDAYKWKDNEESTEDAQCGDAIHYMDETSSLIEETEEAIMAKEDMVVADDTSRQEEGEIFSRHEVHQQYESNTSDNEGISDSKMSEASSNSQPEVNDGEPISGQMPEAYTEVLFTSVSAEDMEFERTLENDDAPEGILLPEIETDGSTCSEPTDMKVKGPTSDSNLENDINMLVNEFGESGYVSQKGPVVDQETEKLGVEATHKRRRWFEGISKVESSPQPSDLVGEIAAMKLGVETGRTTILDDTVETHIQELVTKFGEGSTVEEARSATDVKSDTGSNHEKGKEHTETIHKRRRWFEDREEGVSQPSIVSVEDKTRANAVHESVNSSGECSDKKAANINTVEPVHTHRRRRWFEKEEELELDKKPISLEDSVVNSVVDQETESDLSRSAQSKRGESSGVKEKTDANDQVKAGNGLQLDNDEAKKRRRQRLAVDRVVRETRERILAEAQERAALDKSVGEVRQPVKGTTDDGQEKASTEAKLRAQRAAVERANAEARERALQKAMSGEQAPRNDAALDPKSHSSRFSTPSNSGPLSTDRVNGASGEPARRSQAKQEKKKPTVEERVGKALEEVKMRDLQAQEEQAERNRCADALDAQVKRWSSGKEGNLRALLSTLQYILEPDSGWRPMPLTELVTFTAVRKAYKRAALCVHPDKVQQRGADIKQKYICEKVFDLLKEAWHKFSRDER